MQVVNSGMLFLLFIVAFSFAAVLTYVVKRYAMTRSILDHPNARSLHDLPTPRGGGLAIAATFLLGAVMLSIVGLIPVRLVVALAGGGLVTVVGWLDDRGGISAKIRFAAHTAAAVWALAWLGGLPPLAFGDHVLRLGWIGNLVAVLGIIWWINLYNFMDGIDGLAGSQAVTVAGAVALLMMIQTQSSWAILPVLLSAAAAGFLVFNWPPARIFMGDAGSGFLGFTFAVLAIGSELATVLPAIYWVLLSGVFILDSTLTLARRFLHGETWYEAHRSHAYQRFVVMGHSHKRVTSAVIALNLTIAVVLLLGSQKILSFGLAAAIVLAELGLYYLVIELLRPMYTANSPRRPDRAPVEPR
jgi:Fuc2NAc and GlcNAc transferase